MPQDGSTVSNTVVQRKLGWKDDQYWRARDALVDQGLILRGRGRGGTIKRIKESEPTEVIAIAVKEGESLSVQAVEDAIQREDLLYDPMLSVIDGDWAQDRRSSPVGVEITARQGRRATGGTWSRPDLLMIKIKTYEIVPGKYLEVTTFEVEPVGAIDVQAVYEALAHRRSATHSYVLLHVPPERESELSERIKDLGIVARSHGIGVVVAGKPDDYSTWEEVEEAQRVEPDPERFDRFVATQVSEKLRRKVARAPR